jgi:hypothetical protein
VVIFQKWYPNFCSDLFLGIIRNFFPTQSFSEILGKLKYLLNSSISTTGFLPIVG